MRHFSDFIKTRDWRIHMRANNAFSTSFYFFMHRLTRDISGATAVEYGLLAGLVALGIAGGLGSLSDLVNLLFETVGNEAAEVSANMNGE